MDFHARLASARLAAPFQGKEAYNANRLCQARHGIGRRIKSRSLPPRRPPTRLPRSSFRPINEGRLPWTLAEVRRFLDASGIDYRVLVADDGSTDRTPQLAAAMGRSFRPSRCRGIAARAAVRQQPLAHRPGHGLHGCRFALQVGVVAQGRFWSVLPGRRGRIRQRPGVDASCGLSSRGRSLRCSSARWSSDHRVARITAVRAKSFQPPRACRVFPA